MDNDIHYLMFSQTVEYALRAVVWLAQHPGKPLTRQQIAGATQAPADYLAKVMRALGQAGVVQAGRGVHGGFMLARRPEAISVLEVVNAVDPIRRIHSCPLGLQSHSLRLCPLHRKLDDAVAQIEAAFRSTRLSDLTGEGEQLRPLCEAAHVLRGAASQ